MRGLGGLRARPREWEPGGRLGEVCDGRTAGGVHPRVPRLPRGEAPPRTGGAAARGPARPRARRRRRGWQRGVAPAGFRLRLARWRCLRPLHGGRWQGPSHGGRPGPRPRQAATRACGPGRPRGARRRLGARLGRGAAAAAFATCGREGAGPAQEPHLRFRGPPHQSGDQRGAGEAPLHLGARSRACAPRRHPFPRTRARGEGAGAR
mmetsp:Transcript_22066/g.66302  ORF Transcript_22066/g.66302 Transcript_22066/m.66302 type:complete len:207 (-) Transcript_22066:125-745(-)